MRLDVYLTDQLNIESRSKAAHLIKMNKVLVNGAICTKVSCDVSNKSVEVIEELEFVSMGGYKLDKAIKELNIDSIGKVCLDIGASNGGFTDCLLQCGAAKVFALDVGDTALPFYLLNDPRVVVKERTNARDLTLDILGEAVDIVVIDVSFISLSYILEAAISVLKQGGSLVALIKPQFEVGRKYLSKKGIVLDSKIRDKAVKTIIAMANSLGLIVIDSITAPYREGKNIEYLMYCLKK